MAVGDYNKEDGGFEKEETGLQKFIAYTKKVELARTERYECRFQLPITLNRTIEKLKSPQMRDLVLVDQHYHMTMMCEEVQIPGMVLQNKEIAIGAWNFMRNSNVNFLGNEINLTFLTEVNWELRHVFEAWMAHCVNPESKQVRFPDEQYGTIWINMLSMKGVRKKGVQTDAYERPKSVTLTETEEMQSEANQSLMRSDPKQFEMNKDWQRDAYLTGDNPYGASSKNVCSPGDRNKIYDSKWEPTARTDHLEDGMTKQQMQRVMDWRPGMPNQQDVAYTPEGRSKFMTPVENITAQWELMEVTPKVLNLVPLAWGGVSMARTTLIISSNYWRSRAIDVELGKERITNQEDYYSIKNFENHKERFSK